MSELDKATWRHINYTVMEEKRTLSFFDFLSFVVDGKKYSMKHGTFRNKILKLRKEDKVERTCNSGLGRYTMKGYTFGRATGKLTADNAVLRNKTDETQIFTLKVDGLPEGKRSIHDIHLKFSVPDIWTVITESGLYKSQPYSLDFRFRPMIFQSIKVQISVHRMDTVSVVYACTNNPIANDFNDIVRLSNALTRTEERLSRIVDECGLALVSGYEQLPIPDHDRWTITMCHFGIDSYVEYTGKSFCLCWKDAQNAFLRLYSKPSGKGNSRNVNPIARQTRIERQCRPDMSLGVIVSKVLNPNIPGETALWPV